MDQQQATTEQTPETRELAQLRARVQELESELFEAQSRANQAVAQWQERAYWLDRWHLDLNAVMEKPGASEFRALVRSVRSVLWAFRRARRRLRRP